MGLAVACRHLAHHELHPAARFVNHEHLTVQVQQVVERRVSVSHVSLSQTDNTSALGNRQLAGSWRSERRDAGTFQALAIARQGKRFLMLESRVHWRAGLRSLAGAVVGCTDRGVHLGLRRTAVAEPAAADGFAGLDARAGRSADRRAGATSSVPPRRARPQGTLPLPPLRRATCRLRQPRAARRRAGRPPSWPARRRSTCAARTQDH